MKQLTRLEIQKLNKLNEQLTLIEELIYFRAKEQNQIALRKLLKKEHSIYDYELEAEINFYGKGNWKGKDEDDEHIVTLSENMKSLAITDMSHWGINDKQCHNITTVFQKDSSLNSQKHCWLLHSLYDDYHFSWDDIFCIHNVYFDIKVIYQYEGDFNL